MSRITDIAKTMKTWWNEDDDPFVHRALDEIIRIDQEQLSTIESKRGEWKSVYKYKLHSRPTCTVCGYDGEDEKYGRISSRIVERFCFCPNCGARMKTEDNERDYERAIEQMQHDMLYEPTYNPEDGSM